MAPREGGNKALSPQKPSSFPGIYKYPSERDSPNKNAFQWLEGKKKDDDIGNLWRVHDKLYDLTTFVDKHPGGDYWLRLTQGTDITEAFESSHVVNVKKVEQILAKHYVRDITTPRLSPFTFKPDGFYMTLKQRVEPIFEKVGTGSTILMRMMEDGLVLSFILFSFFGVQWDLLMFKVLAGLTLAMSLMGAHNWFHQKENWRKYYYDLSFLSSVEFQISHSLSHHLYTNTVMDIEISILEPLFQFLPKDKSFFERFAPQFYCHLYYCISFYLDFIKRVYDITIRKRNPRPENFIVVAEFITWMAIAPTVLNGFISGIIIHCVASYWFWLIAVSGSAHHHDECFHDGDEARTDPDFGLCQMDAIRDRGGKLDNTLFIILTTFGAHTLHHLFPTVCHSKLHHVQDIYEKTLQEFNDGYEKVTQFDLFVGFHKQIARTEPRPHPIESKKRK